MQPHSTSNFRYVELIGGKPICNFCQSNIIKFNLLTNITIYHKIRGNRTYFRCYKDECLAMIILTLTDDEKMVDSFVSNFRNYRTFALGHDKEQL